MSESKTCWQTYGRGVICFPYFIGMIRKQIQISFVRLKLLLKQRREMVTGMKDLSLLRPYWEALVSLSCHSN